MPHPSESPAVAGERETLWCVHVIGPDDVHAAPDLRTAVAWAHMLNEFAAERINPPGTSTDDYPVAFANVEAWEGSAESHAAALPRAIADMTPRRAPDADTPFKRAFTTLVRAAERDCVREIFVGPARVRLADRATLPWSMTLRREDAALAQPTAPGAGGGGDLVREVLFLIERLGEFERDHVDSDCTTEALNDWNGHVAPSIARLRTLANRPAQAEAGAAGMEIDHEFKSHPSVFWPAVRGTKTFEYRRDDRGGYHVGQMTRVRCWEPGVGYTNDPPLDRRITNILYGGQFELPEGYCILGFGSPKPEAPDAGRSDGGEFEAASDIGRSYLAEWGAAPVTRTPDAGGLEELRRLSGAASEGPWTACGQRRGGCTCGYMFSHGGEAYVAKALTLDDDVDPAATKEQAKANATFIVAAANYVRALLSASPPAAGPGLDRSSLHRMRLVGSSGTVDAEPGDCFIDAAATWRIVGLTGGNSYSASSIGGCPDVVCFHVSGLLTAHMQRYTHDGLCVWNGDTVAVRLLATRQAAPDLALATRAAGTSAEPTTPDPARSGSDAVAGGLNEQQMEAPIYEAFARYVGNADERPADFRMFATGYHAVAKMAAYSLFPQVDTQVCSAARKLSEAQRAQPEWIWFADDNTDGIPVARYSFGRWAKVEGQAPYIRADILFAALATINPTDQSGDAGEERR